MKAKCENCKFFIKPNAGDLFTHEEFIAMSTEEERNKRLEEEYIIGECHRYPPSTASTKFHDEGCVYISIEVYRDDWCGEFEPKEG